MAKIQNNKKAESPCQEFTVETYSADVGFNPDKKIHIAMVGSGGAKNLRYQEGLMSFKEFGGFCGKVQKGGKHDMYFSRGFPEFEELYVSKKSGHEWENGRFRHDDSLKTANFLILDPDKSKVSPAEMAEVLEKLGYAYFIYTTHSHTKGALSNFRVVVPCFISCKKNMVATAKAFTQELVDAGLDELEYANETGTWSQAWYLPTRDNPDDGIFEFYSSDNFDGAEFREVEGCELETESNAAPSGSADSGGVDDIRRTIETGGEGLHHALRTLSHMLTEDGVAKKTVVMMLQMAMNANPNKDARWQERYDDIDRIVEDPDEESSAGFVLPELNKIEDVVYSVTVEWPPGEFGELCKAVYLYSDYPNRIISIVTALGLVAGITGRRFNINETGLNLYLTILMNTGKGKKVIGQFINRILNDAFILGGSTGSFVGSRRYTGPKSLMDVLSKRRCIVSVFTEAGMMFSSTSGDKSGLTRSILDLYGLSGQFDYTEEETYSDGKNSIPSVQAPCFSMVNESTPDVFLSALKDGTKTGEITRMNIFRTKLESHEINREKKYSITDNLLERVRRLAKHCALTNKDDDPMSSHFVVKQEMFDFSDALSKESEEIYEYDQIKSNMLSRSGLKAWKVAGLISIFNSVDLEKLKDGAVNNLAVDDDAWEWAKSLHEYEITELHEFFKIDDNDELYSVTINKVFPIIIGILNLEYHDPQLQPVKTDRDAKRFPTKMLRRKLNQLSWISAVKGSYGKTGFDAVIDYMVSKKWIQIKDVEIVEAKTEYLILMNKFIGEAID